MRVTRFLFSLRQISALLSFSFLLVSCLAPVSQAVPTPSLPAQPTLTRAPTLTLTPSLTPRPTWTLEPTWTAVPSLTPAPALRRVLIVSFDGLRPDAIAQAPMPNLLALMQTGAYSLTAQTIFPSATLPAHASMLSGMCPTKHGVTWNDYNPAQGYAQGVDLFDLVHAAGLPTIMVVGKQKLSQLTEPTSLTLFHFINDRDVVIADWLVDNFPAEFGLLFVHFPTIDFMGHEYGWLSPEQLSVARRGDEALGKLLALLEVRDLRKDTLVIITADHGGHAQSHGSRDPLDMTIPWVIAGPGIRPGELLVPVQVTDTAATAAWALGLTVPTEWDGVPVREAFGFPVTSRPVPLCP
ncbi:MAG: hypothetical protein DDG60_00365 [Anaerolineae bacterium]|nr:MAG: hypothetical protein DDG60_00365 [Anaerolineae bacterium]